MVPYFFLINKEVFIFQIILDWKLFTSPLSSGQVEIERLDRKISFLLRLHTEMFSDPLGIITCYKELRSFYSY